MNMTIINAEVNRETAEFFYKFGTEMEIPVGEVLNRLLVKVSGGSVREAVELTLWYFNATTSNNNREQQIGILYIFTMMCMTMFEDITPARLQPDENSRHPLPHLQPDTKLSFAVVEETAQVFNKDMAEYGLSESGMVEKAVADFLAVDETMKPYKLLNYMIYAASQLIRPQARMAVIMAITACVDLICELSGDERETVVLKLNDMKAFALQNEDTAKNVRLLKDTGFYKEKIQ